MKLSKKQIYALLILMGLMVIALWFLREEVLSMLNFQG